MRGVTLAWHLARRHHASELSARAWSAPMGLRGYATGDEKVSYHLSLCHPQLALVRIRHDLSGALWLTELV